MRPKTISILALAPTATSGAIAVAQTQTATGGGDLTLNGILATGGVVPETDTNGNARQLTITAAQNESTKTFTVYGKLLKNGPNIAGTPFVGPTGGATTANSPDHFFSVSRIAVSAATASDVAVGVSAVGSCPPYVPDYHKTPFELAMNLIPSSTGSPSFTVQYTLESLQKITAIPQFQNHATMVAVTTTMNGTITFPVAGVRVMVNSGTATAEWNLLQSGAR